MTRMMKLTYALLAVAAVILIDVAVVAGLGLLAPPPETLIISPREVVRIFTEERGKDLSDEDFQKAILLFDDLVMEEAQVIHSTTGVTLVNANHILAGGQDVSAAFARRVIAQWDIIHEAGKQ